MSVILYNIFISTYSFLIHFVALWNKKASKAVSGRKGIFKLIEEDFKKEKNKPIWIHCASLGEFEQGRFLIETIKKQNPKEKIVVTFFSPSGFEAQKNYPFADYIYYLPYDTPGNSKKFLQLINPKLVVFVKYEFWYHYLKIIHAANIPLILISAFFQKNQVFFKPYGGLYREMLYFFNHIFVQDENSKKLLEFIGIKEISIAGDTRFDRCSQILEEPKIFPEIESFKGNKKLIIAGSTWEKDEQLLKETLDKLGSDYKLLIVPHEIEHANIERIKKLIGPEVCIWKSNEMQLKKSKVSILNEIGFLSYVYRYADIVWIGGGFTKSGIHNIIEPAVYGIPIFFGPNYKRFREAEEMILKNGAKSIFNAHELVAEILDENNLQKMRIASAKYVHSQLGATALILAYLKGDILVE